MTAPLFCSPELIAGTVNDYHCPRCKATFRGIRRLPIHSHCRAPGDPPPPIRHALRSPQAGPGRELARLIADLGLHNAGCNTCQLRTTQLNEWGVEGSREHHAEIVGWLRESSAKVGWADKLKAAANAVTAGIKLDWSDPIGSLVDLAIEHAAAKTLTVLVLGHEQAALDQIAPARHLHPVNLTEMEAANRLAESRVFLPGGPFDAPPDAAYLGLATASWNRKYGPVEFWNGRKWPYCLPLERLDELEVGEPNVVWCAAITDDEQWSLDLEALFPGCDRLVDELIANFGLRHKERLGPLANNFIAHRSVTLDHARWMRSAIEYLDGRHGQEWPVSGELHPCFADRLPAFMGECASILYFANRPDLELRQIPPPT